MTPYLVPGGTYTRNAYRILVGKPEGKRPLGDLKVCGRIILEWILGWGGVD
jgi:hypothetical protein